MQNRIFHGRETAVESRTFHRGDIYFIEEGDSVSVGCEQSSNRPAVIISNDTGNQHSGILMIVYLTAQRKKPLPTHVTVLSTNRCSTALCEQIMTVDKSRVGKFYGKVSHAEMERIDRAVMISLGIALKKAEITDITKDPRYIRLEAERDVYRKLFEKEREKEVS